MHTDEEHKYFEELAVRAAVLFYENTGKDEESLITLMAVEFGDVLLAKKLYAFLPMAFGWALLKRMGVSSLPGTFILLDKNGNDVEFKVSDQSIFMGALSIAYKVFEYGYTAVLTKEVVTELINNSVEVIAANKALNAGEDIKGSDLHPSKILSIAAEELSLENS